MESNCYLPEVHKKTENASDEKNKLRERERDTHTVLFSFLFLGYVRIERMPTQLLGMSALHDGSWEFT